MKPLVNQLIRTNPRFFASLTILIAIACVVLMASSLDGFDFQPGKPFPTSGQVQGSNEHAAQPRLSIETATPVLGGIAALASLLLMACLPILLLRAVNWRRVAAPLFVLVFLLILAVGLQWVGPAMPTPAAVGSGRVELPPTFDYPVSPLGNPPSFFRYLVIAGVLLVGAAATFTIYMIRQNEGSGKDPVLAEAARAAEDLDKGAAWQNVIIRCYAEMCKRLLEERGLRRNAPMTAREFQEQLASRGVPAEPVAQLTTLFEKARYGSGDANDDDKRQAQKSLKQIIQYCRQKQL